MLEHLNWSSLPLVLAASRREAHDVHSGECGFIRGVSGVAHCVAPSRGVKKPSFSAPLKFGLTERGVKYSQLPSGVFPTPGSIKGFEDISWLWCSLGVSKPECWIGPPASSAFVAATAAATAVAKHGTAGSWRECFKNGKVSFGSLVA